MRYECEVFVGLSHGQWITKTVEIDVPDEGDGDFDGALRDLAEDAALMAMGDEPVAFTTLASWNSVEEPV